MWARVTADIAERRKKRAQTLGLPLPQSRPIPAFQDPPEPLKRGRRADSAPLPVRARADNAPDKPRVASIRETPQGATSLPARLHVPALRRLLLPGSHAPERLPDNLVRLGLGKTRLSRV